MNRQPQGIFPWSKRVWMPATVIAVFAAVIAILTLYLRDQIRRRMLEHEARIVHSVARFEASHPGMDTLDLVLGLVELDGVIGVRLHDPEGRGVAALPDTLVQGSVPADVATDLAAGRPVSRLETRVWLATEFADPFATLSDEPVPLLRVFVPITAEQSPPGSPVDMPRVVAAEFLFDGTSLADAFSALDRRLLLQSAVALLLGGGIITAILVVGFRRIDRKTRELADANRELTMQARTSAVGAVSAHLIHGMRNALAGMYDDDEEDAAGAARRLQAMVQEVVDILREENGGPQYSLASGEILGLVVDKLGAAAAARDIRLETAGDLRIPFTNRQGNLVLLVVENLVRNAVEASPVGATVTMLCEPDSHGAVFRIRDHAGGLPETVRSRLFHPVPSSKENGTGIGLSISRQLARSLGGDLALVRSDTDVTEFALRVPAAAPATTS